MPPTPEVNPEEHAPGTVLEGNWTTALKQSLQNGTTTGFKDKVMSAQPVEKHFGLSQNTINLLCSIAISLMIAMILLQFIHWMIKTQRLLWEMRRLKRMNHQQLLEYRRKNIQEHMNVYETAKQKLCRRLKSLKRNWTGGKKNDNWPGGDLEVGSNQ